MMVWIPTFVSIELMMRSKQTMLSMTPAAKLSSRLTVREESFPNMAPTIPPSPVPPTPATAVTKTSMATSIFSPSSSGADQLSLRMHRTARPARRLHTFTPEPARHPCAVRIRNPGAAKGGSLRGAPPKIPLWLETSPFRRKRAVDKTAEPMKTSSVPPQGGQSARPLSVGRFSQSADGATVSET